MWPACVRVSLERRGSGCRWQNFDHACGDGRYLNLPGGWLRITHQICGLWWPPAAIEADPDLVPLRDDAPRLALAEP